MLSHICLCLMLMTMTYIIIVNAKPAPSANTDLQKQKYSDAAMIERFNSDHFLLDHPYDDDDDIDDEEILHDKRQLKKKWAKFYQGAQSPYTIAFPALIRTRRWVE